MNFFNDTFIYLYHLSKGLMSYGYYRCILYKLHNRSMYINSKMVSDLNLFLVGIIGRGGRMYV